MIRARAALATAALIALGWSLALVARDSPGATSPDVLGVLGAAGATLAYLVTRRTEDP